MEWLLRGNCVLLLLVSLIFLFYDCLFSLYLIVLMSVLPSAIVHVLLAHKLSLQIMSDIAQTWYSILFSSPMFPFGVYCRQDVLIFLGWLFFFFGFPTLLFDCRKNCIYQNGFCLLTAFLIIMVHRFRLSNYCGKKNCS